MSKVIVFPCFSVDSVAILSVVIRLKELSEPVALRLIPVRRRENGPAGPALP